MDPAEFFEIMMQDLSNLGIHPVLGKNSNEKMNEYFYVTFLVFYGSDFKWFLYNLFDSPCRMFHFFGFLYVVFDGGTISAKKLERKRRAA